MRGASNPPYNGGLIQNPIDFADMQTAAVGLAGQARLRYNNNTNTLQVSLSGAAYVDISTGGGGVTLGQAVNAGNQVNSVAASGQITWTTGGTYDASTTPEIKGPSDQTFFVSSTNTTAGTLAANGFVGVQVGTTQATSGALQMFAANTGFTGGFLLKSGTSGSSNGATISAPSANSTTNATAITITGGSFTGGGGGASILFGGGSSTQPGFMTIASGSAGTNQNGGNVSITAANGNGTGFGGTASLTAGGATGNNNVGSDATVAAGGGNGSGRGGNSFIQGGNGGATGTGGTSTVLGGFGGATSGNGGAAQVAGGAAQASGTGGMASVIGGASVGSNLSAGNATIDTGTSTGNAGGTIAFNIAPAGVSGSGSNASVNAFNFTYNTTGGSSVTTPNATGTDASSAPLSLSTGNSTGFGSGTLHLLATPYGYASGTSTNSPTEMLGFYPNQNSLSGTTKNIVFSSTFANGGNASNGNHSFLYLNPVYNYTGTKTDLNTDLQIDRVETSLASGGQNFLLFRSGAAGTTFRFGVDNLGNVSSAGNYSNGNNGSIATTVLYAASQISGTQRWQVALADFTSAATGVGGGVQFNGWTNGQTGQWDFGSVQGVKENGTAANTAGTLILSTSVNSAHADPKWAITSAGNLQGRSAMVLSWNSSATDPTAATAADTGISRDAAASIDFGNGSAASKTATLNYTKAILQAGGGIGFRGASPGTDQILWGTGGTFTVSSPQIMGPTDAVMWITSGNTQAITISGATGAANTTGSICTIQGGTGGNTNGAGGSLSLSGGTGGSTGAGGATSLNGGNAGGGTDKAAGGVTVSSGTPTGLATGNINAQTGFTNASGTTAQTMGDRFFIAGHSVTMSNTTATATTILVLNVPTSNSGGGCMVIYQVVATDGTNFNTATGSFTVSCSNKAGTVTATTAAITDESSNVNSGTLSAGAVTTTIASQAVSIKIAPTFTVIAPTSVICNVTIIPFGKGVTVTAQ